MSFLMIPLFSRALAGAGPGGARAATRQIVASTLPRVTAVLVATSALAALGAPLLVHTIAPGLADPALAVTCTRLTSLTILTFGLAGFVSAALRANHVFGAPATIHLSYNIGILGLMATLGGRLGIVSAAAGVAVGSVLMVLAQLPSFVRHVGFPRSWRATGPTVTLGAFAPLAVYTIARQAQVFVERYLGSSLPPGTISHLNYAQKVAQMPMLVALLVCTVTFPALARSVAAGEAKAARERLEADLRTVIALIFVSAAYLIAFAPQVVAVLLEHGEFTAADTADTAAILRVYAVGLIGHALVGVLSRAFYTGERRSWYPAVAMGIGLAVTALLAVAGVPYLHAYAIAAANGAGIVTTAVLLLFGLRDRIVAVSLRAVGSSAARLGGAALVAGAAGWLAGHATAGWPTFFSAAAGGLLVLLVFAGVAHLAGADEIGVLAAQIRRRLPHGR
jgi:putative peptidoglycan lipid II flippase